MSTQCKMKASSTANTKSPSLPKVNNSTKSNINETSNKTTSSINKAANNTNTNKSKSNTASTTKASITSVALPIIKNASINKVIISTEINIEQNNQSIDNIDIVKELLEKESTTINKDLDTSTNIEQSNTASDVLIIANPLESNATSIIPQIETRIIHNNGKVILNYFMYNEDFPIANGCLTQAEIDDMYCLSDAMPGCSIHLSKYPPNIGRQLEADNVPFEDIYIHEDPKGTYHDLEDNQTLYVYVEEEAQQLARDQARMRVVLASSIVIPNKNDVIIRDDGRNMESCSCIYGNPCVDEYGCKDWDNRNAIAKANGWKGF